MSQPAPKRRRTQAERRDEAEQRMNDAAVELIAEKGFRGLVLSEIGTRAGYSATLPLHYYKTKEDLILLIAERILADYRAMLRRDLAGATGLDALRAFVHTYLRFAKEYPQKRRALFMITSEAAVHAPLKESIANLSRRGAAGLARMIRDGQASGEIAPDIDADTFGSFILATLRGIVSVWAVDDAVDLPALAVALEGSIVESLRTKATQSASSRPRTSRKSPPKA